MDEALTREQERVIGMAGVLQAASLVQQLARTGMTDAETENATVQSLLAVDAESTPAVFGGIRGVRSGLELIRDKLVGARSELDVEVLKYAVALTTLQRALYRKQKYYSLLVEGIGQLQGLEGDDLYDAAAETYMQAVSPLSPRIYVQGGQGFLQHERVPERVRTFLLGGIRAAVLWQQKGGSRFEVLLHRGRYRRIAGELVPGGPELVK